MRLLNTTSLELKWFLEDYRPPYAILSHFWTLGEVTLEDIQNDDKHKDGWTKIRYSCDQAMKDGLGWLWVDTLCIDKRSSAELSEAINSMFRWYAEATICYAYLADVRDLYEGIRSSEDAFSETRWFSRGWTLQELIAPREVEFFDRAWTYISSRTTAAQQISRITGIDVFLLQNNRGNLYEAIASHSVAQRMSWAANRTTTRIEDAAYSLIGLFDVNMPLLYGEGHRAFTRLQEEIMKASGDLSVLAWSAKAGTLSGMPMDPLASSLFAFASCTSVIPAKTSTGAIRASEMAMTNIGLRIHAPIILTSEPEKTATGLAMILNCRHDYDITNVIALKLSPTLQSSGDAPEGGIQQETLDCVIGWPGQSEQDRLILVDVLEANRNSKMKTVMIRRGHLRDLIVPSGLVDRRREWTHVWLRFHDTRLSNNWNTLNLYPKQYWHHQSRTFDLSKARRERVEQDEKLPKSSRTSIFGLPIYGAIALEDKGSNCVSIFFCQRSPSLSDGFTFEVAPYDSQSFLTPDQRLLDRSVTPSHALRLKDGSVFEAELRVEEISEHVVAHLAAAVSNPINDQQLRGAGSQYRSPLHMMRRHRDSSDRGSTPGADRRGERVL